MNKHLERKIYSMLNSFLPLDMFFNDIRNNNVKNFDKEVAFKDLEIIADFILNQKKRIDELEEENKQLKALSKIICDEINDISNGYWKYFRDGNQYITSDDLLALTDEIQAKYEKEK